MVARLADPIDPYAAEASPTPWRGWGLIAYAAAVTLAGGIGYFVVHVPFQVSDNITNLIEADRESYGGLLARFGVQRSFLWITLKAAQDLSGGYYVETFRAIQVLQLVVLFVLVVRAFGVRSARGAAAVPLCLVVLAGFHTFRNLVQEAYPINTYLSNLVFLAAALNLPLARPGWRTDAAAILLLVVATLTLETGLLLWVAYVAAYWAGSRGVSRRAILLATALVMAFVGTVIYGLAGASAASATNAPTGFGFSVIDPEDVAGRFGPTPWVFWGYNIAASIMTVLFAEPRRGLFNFVAAFVGDDLRPSHWLLVGTTTATTLLLAGFAIVRMRAWLRDDIPPRERWVIVFGAVLAGNAVMSFAYTKDDIMSPAGLLYAVALYGVVSTILARPLRRTWSLLAAVPMLIIACAWSVRVLDVPQALIISGLRNQTDWARLDQWKAQNHFEERAAEYAPMVDRLQAEALRMHVPNLYLWPWMRRWERNYSAASQ